MICFYNILVFIKQLSQFFYGAIFLKLYDEKIILFTVREYTRENKR